MGSKNIEAALLVEISSCGTPESPVHSVVTVSGMTATYSCTEGYSIQGQGGIQCTEGGWSTDIPTCKGKLDKI